MDTTTEIASLREVLASLRLEGKILLAILYGSFARGTPHARSDIDLAIYLHTSDDAEASDIIDRILMSADREISILRLDDEDESPFVVQEALMGVHLVAPDIDSLYAVARRALHEAESIRFRREGHVFG